MEPLKLAALDGEDLDVVSTHVQDSVVTVGDILWRPAERRLVVVVNRFDWEAAKCGDGQYRRRRAALRFDRVNGLKARNIACGDKDVVLNLLAVEFTATDTPAGCVTLIFSGDKALRLDVECLEAELADLGPVWATTICPAHQDGEVKTA